MTTHQPAGAVGPRTVLRRAALVLAILLLAALAACSPSAGPPLPGPAIPEGAAESSSVPTASAPAELTAQDVETWLDGRLPAALQRADIPGATVAVVHDGQILTTRGYGYADTGTAGSAPVPVDAEQSLFRIGSVSKLATATAVMQLVESGQVDLDTDISAYVEVEIDRRFDGDITLRNLLTHTAGFEERISGLILPEGSEVDLAEYSTQDVPQQVYEPGTTPAYSNYGLALAGYIVEQVSGLSFDDYLDQHVFEPAGMDSATFRQPVPAELEDRLALGYPALGEPAQGFEMVSAPPAGSMTASALDMGHFMLALLGDTDAESQLLSEQTREVMQAPALDEESLGRLAAGQRMGIGFFEESRNGHRLLGHGGDTQFFHAALDIYPDDATGIFVAVNGSGEDSASLHLRADLLGGFADRYFPGEDTAQTGQRPDPADSQERAELLAGRYESTRSPHSTFLTGAMLLNASTVTALDEGRIVVGPDPGNGGTTVFEEVEPWVWQEVDGHRRFAAHVEDGQVLRIGHDSAMSLVPISPARNAVLPVLAVATAAAALIVVAWPAGVLWRWIAARRAARRTAATGAQPGAGSTGSRPAPLGRAGRLARLGAAAAVVAVAGWAAMVQATFGFVEVPTLVMRLGQVLQLLGVVAIIPAAIDLVTAVRRRAGLRRVVIAAVLLLALIATAWATLVLQVFAVDLTP